MQLLFTILILSLLLPVQAAIMARSFGRNMWLWIFITLPLPLISNFILLCLGDKSEAKVDKKTSPPARVVATKRAKQFGPKQVHAVANV